MRKRQLRGMADDSHLTDDWPPALYGMRIGGKRNPSRKDTYEQQHWRRPVAEPDPDRDDLRGRDDLISTRPSSRSPRPRSSMTWACPPAACNGRSTPTC